MTEKVKPKPVVLSRDLINEIRMHLGTLHDYWWQRSNKEEVDRVQKTIIALNKEADER